MTPDLTKLSNDALELPPGEVFEAEINEDATEEGQEVTCVIPSHDPLLATEPMAWTPYVNATGVYFPKLGDRAKVSENGDGPGVVLWWRPSASEPDVSF